MSNNNQFGDLNLAYILGLYEDYLIDPESVGEDLVIFFNSEDFKKHKTESNSPNHSEISKPRDNISNNSDETLILNQIRKEGHKYAKLDPLNLIAKKEYLLKNLNYL